MLFLMNRFIKKHCIYRLIFFLDESIHQKILHLQTEFRLVRVQPMRTLSKQIRTLPSRSTSWENLQKLQNCFKQMQNFCENLHFAICFPPTRLFYLVKGSLDNAVPRDEGTLDIVTCSFSDCPNVFNLCEHCPNRSERFQAGLQVGKTCQNFKNNY